MKIDPSGKIVRFITNPWNAIAADAIPLLTAAYFTFKKLSGFSLEDSLDTFIRPAGVTKIIGLALAVILYATLMKVANVTVGILLGKISTPLDYTSFLHLYKKNNVEIENHLKLISLPGFNREKFENFHSYEKNINLLVYSLNEHIKSALHESKLKQKDLCISYYHRKLGDSSGPLDFELLTHYEPSCFDIKTVVLSPNRDTTKEYAGARAISTNGKVCITNCSSGEYVKAGVKRRKTARQFFAIPLETSGTVEGLVNIEIHHKECFASIKQMEEFYSNHIYGFKCLFEYQLLKRKFFAAIADKLKQ